MKLFAAQLLVAAGEHEKIDCHLRKNYSGRGTMDKPTAAVVVANHTNLLKLVARVACGLGDNADAADAFITALDFEYDNTAGSLVAY